MSRIVSFNGVDGSGKTTQLNLLAKNNPKLIGTVSGFKEFLGETKTLVGDFKWWFIDSTPSEFANEIYKILDARNLYICNIQKPIIIVDKGIKNFDARTIATLMYKGLSKNDALELISEVKYKYRIENIEDEDLFFNIAQTIECRKAITKQRKFSDLDLEKAAIYSKYQDFQNLIIQEQLNNGEYIEFDATGSIEEVNLRLSKKIFNKYK